MVLPRAEGLFGGRGAEKVAYLCEPRRRRKEKGI